MALEDRYKQTQGSSTNGYLLHETLDTMYKCCWG